MWYLSRRRPDLLEARVEHWRGQIEREYGRPLKPGALGELGVLEDPAEWVGGHAGTPPLDRHV